MDTVDRQMLTILQRDGRISNAALADELRTSPPRPACAGCGRSSGTA